MTTNRGARRSRRRPARWRAWGLTGMALVGLSLVAAACSGGSSTTGVASIGGVTTTNAAAGTAASQGPPNLQKVYQAQLAFSQCMRTHGEPSFPDPVLSAHGIEISGGHIDANSPQFIAANAACKKLVPNGGPPSPAQVQKQITTALKFAACMRSHGVPNFPDPKVSSGRVQIRIGGPGIDPNSPPFQAALKACQSLSPLGLGG